MAKFGALPIERLMGIEKMDENEDFVLGGLKTLCFSASATLQLAHDKTAGLNEPVEIHKTDLFIPENFREFNSQFFRAKTGGWAVRSQVIQTHGRRLAVRKGWYNVVGNLPADYWTNRENYNTPAKVAAWVAQRDAKPSSKQEKAAAAS